MQHKLLCALHDAIDCHYPPTFEVDELETFGVVRWTDLDFDSQSPCDFEKRFFAPCYDKDSGLEEEVDEVRRLWRESLDSGKDSNPEWVPNASFMYPTVRARWFTLICSGLRADYEGEPHPINTYMTPYLEDLGFLPPDRGDRNELTYITGSVQTPTTTDMPHMAIMMFDSTVAPQGKVLRSEVDAIVTLLREQARSGQFTHHHTKPVLIYTFQHETHVRITQAHLDAKTNKIIVRQSRQLDLRGKAKCPPPDALLLLRWLLNAPVGATQYEEPTEGAAPPPAERHGTSAEALVEVEVKSR